MPLTLLLDLDDTLLNTNMADFVPAYFQALAAHLSRWVKPDLMLPALMSGTQAMLANEDPSKTLQQVFDADFYPRLGIPKQELQQAIEDFYDNAFPLLQNVTSQRAGARELIDWAVSQGYRVAIATEPLLPLKAIHERIRWAGLDPARFDVISSYEAFHFTKSHAAYYAELLGRLGWPDGPVLMVGNDLDRDLACAQELGLATYQVSGKLLASFNPVKETRAARTTGYGSLTDLREWLSTIDVASLEPSLGGREAIMAILTSTPAVMHSMARELKTEDWRREPTPEDWAFIEIICHLRDTEREVHHPQIEILEQETEPFVPRPEAAVWAKQRNYLDEDGALALSNFTAARRHTLRELRTFVDAVWDRPARHAIFGPTSAREVIGFIADHDRLHIQQAWHSGKASK